MVWDVARPEQPSRIRGVWMAGFSDRDMPPTGHRLVAHPTVTLVLDFGAEPPLVDDASGRRHRGSLVAGLGLGGAVRVRGENIDAIQVRLSPLVAESLLGVRLADIAGGLVSLDDLWGAEAVRIGERLTDARSWPERFAIADTALADRWAEQRLVDPQVQWAWEQMRLGGGDIRVDRLAAELGWSRKRLWSRFQSQIGLPPKQAARLVRFDIAAHRLVAGHRPALVAADCGYTDQAHLHREVVAFAGVTPGTVPNEPFLAVDATAWPTDLRQPHAEGRRYMRH